MRKILAILIFSQLLLIAYLFNRITLQSSSQVLGNNTSINIIRQADINIQPNSNLKYFYELKPNSIQEIYKDWLPSVVRYTINNDSLNERFDYPVKKEQQTFRIITLGDSFTFGQNVSTENNWTELLEDYLNKNKPCPFIKRYEVINLAVHAYDTQYEVERYRLRGVKYNPDLVIWTFTDFERDLEQIMPDVKKNEQKVKDLEKKGIYYENWKIAKENLVKKVGKEGIKKLQSEQINKINQFYQGPLLFITLPNYQEYIELLKQEVKNRPHSYYFQPKIKYEDRRYFLPDEHFNNEGHKKMMEEIVGILEKDKLLPYN